MTGGLLRIKILELYHEADFDHIAELRNVVLCDLLALVSVPVTYLKLKLL